MQQNELHLPLGFSAPSPNPIFTRPMEIHGSGERLIIHLPIGWPRYACLSNRWAQLSLGRQLDEDAVKATTGVLAIAALALTRHVRFLGDSLKNGGDRWSVIMSVDA